MSLIDEALKRARQEAARQDAEARELRYRQVPVIPGLRQQRPRRSWLLPAVIAGCLAAGIGIGVGLTLARNDGGEMQAAATPPAPPATATASAPLPQETPTEAPAPPPPVVEEAPPVVEEESTAPAPPAPVAPAPAPVPQEEPRIADMRTREISLTPAAPRPQPEAPPAPAPTPPAPTPSTPAAAEPSAPAPTPAAPGEIRTYQQEVPLAGGGTLRLSGIAFSEQPVALFGDKVVAQGETVAGYKVVAIEARWVRLEGAGGTVVVELP